MLSSSNDPTGVFFLLNILLVATMPVVIARALWRRQVVDVRTVLGAVCIYVLLGMMFAFVYAAINGIDDTPFFVQTTHATTPDFLYFSFITQTTVGYGDFTAAGDLGRALAVVEALGGQLYLVTVIAVLVSRLSRRPLGRRIPAEAATTGRATSTDLVAESLRRARRRSRAGRAGRGSRAARATAGSRPRRSTNTISTDHSVGSGAAAAESFMLVGRMYGLLRDAPPDDHRRHRAHGEHARTGVVLRAAGARATRSRRSPTGSPAGARAT